MQEPKQPLVLTLTATAFNKEQLQRQLDALDVRKAIQIAFVGRSNVGKSSLINAMARRKQLARVSATPGKTRSINFYWVEPDGFSLIDLPGYGYARCSYEEQRNWANLIEFYLADRPSLKAVALLLDCRIPPQALDRDFVSFARQHALPFLPVLTKADKCSRVEQVKKQREWSILLNGLRPLIVSVKQLHTVTAMWAAIRTMVQA